MNKAYGKLVTDSDPLYSLILDYGWGWIRTNLHFKTLGRCANWQHQLQLK